MTDESVKGGFDFYLRFAKPLVINLPDPNDRVLAAAWIQTLRSDKCGNEKLRTSYLKLLLFVLQRKRLMGLFRDKPSPSTQLPDIPVNTQIVDIAKNLLQADENDRRDRLRGLISGGGGDFPPYNIECSADLLEYAASQNIPKFGIHAYYAISKSPITTWDNVDCSFLPKGISLDKGSEGGELNISTAASRPEIADKSRLSIPAGSKSMSRSKISKIEKRAPKTEAKKSSKRIPTKSIPAKSPLGSNAPVEERSPPTWGSNLIEVTDPPQGADFQLSLAGDMSYADIDLFNMEQTDYYDKSASSYSKDRKKVAHEYTMSEQFELASISPGTPKSQDIIDEVNTTLHKSAKDLSLDELTAEIDAKYPDRRKDMPSTPPIFSKYEQIKAAGRDIQYSAADFGIGEDEAFTHGPTYLEDVRYSPRTPFDKQDDRTVDLGIERHLEQVGIESDSFLENLSQDVLIDDIDDITEDIQEAVRTPRSVHKKLQLMRNEIEVMKEDIPARRGIPLTTPKRSPSPGRKSLSPSPNHNLVDELFLFAENLPDVSDEIADTSFYKTPKKSPKDVTSKSPSSPSPKKWTPDKLVPRYSPLKPAISSIPVDPRTSKSPQSSTSAKIPVSGTTPKQKTAEHQFEALYNTLIGDDNEDRPLSDLLDYTTNQEDVSSSFETSDYEEIPWEPDIYISPSPTKRRSKTPEHIAPLTEQVDYDSVENLSEVGDDIEDSQFLHELPKVSSTPLQELGIEAEEYSRSIPGAPDIFEDVAFQFEYEPLDIGASAKLQQLYDRSEDHAPAISSAKNLQQRILQLGLVNVPRSPIIPPGTSKMTANIPSFWEMENVPKPDEFQQMISGHDYTERHVSRDPERKLATKKIRSGSHQVPLHIKAPKPGLPTIIDMPLAEVAAEQMPLPPPARRKYIKLYRAPKTPPGYVEPPPFRYDMRTPVKTYPGFPPEVVEKLQRAQIVRRELKDSEKKWVELLDKELQDKVTKLLASPIDLIKDEMLDIDRIEINPLRRPPTPPLEKLYFDMDEEFQTHTTISQLVPIPKVVLEPEEMPEYLTYLKSDEANIKRQQKLDFLKESEEVIHFKVPIAETESPTELPDTPEFLENIKKATKGRRPQKMRIHRGTGNLKKVYTKPLKHYERYLDTIEESPGSPDSVNRQGIVNWQEFLEEIIEEFHDDGGRQNDLSRLMATPNVYQAGAKGKKGRRAEDLRCRRKLVFPKNVDDEGNILPKLPKEYPEDLLGHYYDMNYVDPVNLLDKNIRAKGLQSPLAFKQSSPQYLDDVMTSPIQTLSPLKLENLHQDLLNQQMMMDFPEEIHGEIEKPPDPYAFMESIHTELEDYEPVANAQRAKAVEQYEHVEHFAPVKHFKPLESIGTEHDGFAGSTPAFSITPTKTKQTRPIRHVSPSSPFGLDEMFRTPEKPIEEKYSHEEYELWMEYEPIDYFAVSPTERAPVRQIPPTYQPPTQRRKPQKPKTPPKYIPSPSTPESPIFQQYILPEYVSYTPPLPPPPPKPRVYTPKQLTPKSPEAEANLLSPRVYQDSLIADDLLPEKLIADLTQDEFFSQDLNELSDHFEQVVSPLQSPKTPPQSPRTPQNKYPKALPPGVSPSSEQYSPLPSPYLISDEPYDWNIAYDTSGDESDVLNETADILTTSPVHGYAPLTSPNKSPLPSTPLNTLSSFQLQLERERERDRSPNIEEFQAMMAAHEYNERYRTRDPERRLATQTIRPKGGKPFHLKRKAPRPKFAAISDLEIPPISPEVVHLSPAPITVWSTPPGSPQASQPVPARFDDGGYQISPRRDYTSDFIGLLPSDQTVKRNLFQDYKEDSLEANDITPPVYTDDAWFISPESPETPPHAGYSPRFQRRMQRSIYDGSAPYADSPMQYTPPSGSRRKMHTYTPPPRAHTPEKPTYEELIQKSRDAVQTPTPEYMGMYTDTGDIRPLATRPLETFKDNLEPLWEVGESPQTPATPTHRRRPLDFYYPPTPITPPSVRRQTYTPPRIETPPSLPYRRTYTPPRIETPPSLPYRRTYTPPPVQSPASPYLWSPTRYTPPPRALEPRFSPASPISPRFQQEGQHEEEEGPCGSGYPCRARTPGPKTPQSPTVHSRTPKTPARTPGGLRLTRSQVRRNLFDASPMQDDSPSTVLIEQDVEYELGNAFGGDKTMGVLDTSDIQDLEDAEMNFQWIDRNV